MPSRILPMDEIERLGRDYFLPPGGQDNGVPATYWAVVAELDTAEVAPVLVQLANAGVGAYVAAGTGFRPRGGTPQHRLYIDAMQYNQAVDALMVFLRGKETRDLGGYVPTKRVPVEATPERRTSVRVLITAVKVVLGAAALALLVAVGYQAFVERYGVVQPGTHQPTAPAPTP